MLYWWIIFNNPEACQDGCGLDDLFRLGVDASARFASGHVVGADGSANFAGSLKIEGIVENYTNNTYDWTTVIISAKDANNKYLGNTDTYLKPKLIRPGGTSTFETYILNVTNNTSRLSISYSFDGDIIR